MSRLSHPFSWAVPRAAPSARSPGRAAIGLRSAALVALAALFGAGCSEEPTRFGGRLESSLDAAGPADAPLGGAAGLADVLVPPGGKEDAAPARDAPPGTTGTLHGTVWAPGNAPRQVPAGQEIPIYGALVSVTSVLPDPIPQGVYCASCVWPAARGAVSDERGRFTIPDVPPGTWYLTVEKGQFRRTSRVTIEAGQTMWLSETQTTLPNVHDPDRGLWIPRIALALGSYDALEDVFGKLGLGRVNAWGAFEAGSAKDVIDVYDNRGTAQSGVTLGTLGDLVTDLERMMTYHIIFIPCSGNQNTAVLREQGVLGNLRDYVEAGGRLYVTDWSGEWFDAVFPGPVDLGPEGIDTPALAYDAATDTWAVGLFGSADGFHYNSPNAQAVDEHLWGWLDGQKAPSPLSDRATDIDPDGFYIEGNWNTIEALSPYSAGTDELGQPVVAEPHTFVAGGSEHVPLPRRPMTVTFEPAGCGRVMYSTYHTNDHTHVGLTAQERVLIYLIMEMLVCHDPKHDFQ
jgi:hypothetical protein